MKIKTVSKLFASTIAAVALSASPAAADEVQEITLTPDATGLKYATPEFTVKAGKKVKITFDNKSPVPQPHNLLIIAPGSVNEIGALANGMLTDPKAMEKNYIPESDKILHTMPIIQPEKTGVMEFEAPKEPGVYPFICTFPGHWMLMQGKMTVEE